MHVLAAGCFLALALGLLYVYTFHGCEQLVAAKKGIRIFVGRPKELRHFEKFDDSDSRYVTHDRYIYANLAKSPYATLNPAEADFFLVPYFSLDPEISQERLARIDQWMMSVSPDKTRTRWIWLMAHDLGRCNGFTNFVTLTDLVPYQTQKSVVVSPLGDGNNPCFDPRNGIVIPARSRNAAALYGRFQKIDAIKPFRARRNAFCFRGRTYEEFFQDKHVRFHISRLKGTSDIQSDVTGPSMKGSEYFDWLESCRFHLVPRGIVGWSFRLAEVIYSGGIPVLVSDWTALPWTRTLLKSKFVIRVKEKEVRKIPALLSSISSAQGARMQEEVLSVRDSFIYGGDPWKDGGIMRRLVRELEMLAETNIYNKRFAE